MPARRLALPFALLLTACSGAAPPPETLETSETPTTAAETPPAVPVAEVDLVPTTIQLDLDQLQGTWRTVGRLKAVKNIRGNRETVTYYDRREQIVAQHTADFALLRGLDDTVRVIAWSNLRVLKGTPPPETSGAYVYNCDGKRLVEFRGALGVLAPRGFTDAVVWKRSGQAPRQRAPGRRDALSRPAAR